jgi:hypothetical protein
MVLLIFMNRLYSAKGNEEKQDFVRRRISYHHWIKHFDEQKLELVVMRYAFMHPLNVPPALTISCRPTGWHGESRGTSGGHITADFLTMDGVFVKTKHVYCNDAAYEGKWIKFDESLY